VSHTKRAAPSVVMKIERPRDGAITMRLHSLKFLHDVFGVDRSMWVQVAVSTGGRQGLEPVTYSFNINDGDRCRIVRNTAGYLEMLRMVSAGWYRFRPVEPDGLTEVKRKS
jgi:hypothetical protein